MVSATLLGTDLLRWFGAIAPSKPQVVLIQQRHGLTPSLPTQEDVIDV